MGNNQSESMGEIVRRRLGSKGLHQVAYAAQICFIANELAAGRYEAVRYREGVLTLRASNAVVLDELTLDAHQLTQTIKHRLGWSVEKSLRIRLVLTD